MMIPHVRNAERQTDASMSLWRGLGKDGRDWSWTAPDGRRGEISSGCCSGLEAGIDSSTGSEICVGGSTRELDAFALSAETALR